MHCHIPFAEFQRRFHRVGQPGERRLCFFLVFRSVDHQAVNYRFDGVDFVAIHLNVFVQLVHLPIHARSHKACLADLFQHSLMRSLSSAHQRSKQQQARPFRQTQYLIYNFLGRLTRHLPSTDGAMRDAGAGEEQAQVVVDFGHRPHSGAWVMRSALLIN